MIKEEETRVKFDFSLKSGNDSFEIQKYMYNNVEGKNSSGFIDLMSE